jgi:hypothetical protein
MREAVKAHAAVDDGCELSMPAAFSWAPKPA